VKIKRPGIPETRIEIDIANVGSTVDEFQAIGEGPAKFAAFVNARRAAREALPLTLSRQRKRGDQRRAQARPYMKIRRRLTDKSARFP